MCQTKAEGGKRCKSASTHCLLLPGSHLRKGLNSGDPVSLSALEELAEESKQWRQNLTEDEEDDVRAYTYTGYMVVNSYLRNDEGRRDRGGNKRALEYVENLDSALAKAPKVPERLVYRSVFVPPTKRLEGKTRAESRKAWVEETFKEGEIISFPEYLSTSADSDLVVRNNERKTKKGIHAVLEIVTTSGAVLHQEKQGTGWSIQDDEKEILLPRDKKFKVVKVYQRVRFESTYKIGLDNQWADEWSSDWDGEPYETERIRATVPVIQLIEVED